MRRIWFVLFVALALVATPSAASPSPRQQRVDEIAYVRDAGDQADIYLVPAEGGRPRNLISSGANDAGPSFSPDGQRLVFASSRDGTWDLYVLTLPEKVTRITSLPGSEFDPQWSPNGKLIAFESTIRGQRDVYVIPASGGTPRNVSQSSAMDLDPWWTVDSRQVVFESDRGGGTFHLYSAPIAGKMRRLTSGSSDDFHPSVSPNGDQVAFERSVQGNYDLYLLDLKTRKLTRLTSSRAEDAEPAWSPDATRLAFVSDRGGHYDVFTLTLASKKVVDVTRTANVDETSPVWRTGAGALGARTPAMVTGISCPTTGPLLSTDGRDVLAAPSTSSVAVTICGKKGNDDLTGANGADSLAGDAGADLLHGRAGNDHLYGGLYTAGLGTDRLYGDGGDDRLFARGDYARDCVWGGTGAADWGRLGLGTNSWSDNRNPGPTRVPAWPVVTCGSTASIETLD
jgi:dipeptidyl aminopeptidase/acylaminoacyl peptidase